MDQTTINQHNVLIIDDEKPIAKALEAKLKSAGFTVTISDNGEEGMHQLAKNSFSVVLLDILMPVMNGWTVLETLKQMKSNAKVIVITNSGQEEDENKAKELGAVGYIVKSNETLARVVELVNNYLKD